MTIEGSPASAALARGHLGELGLAEPLVEVRTGRFDEVLPGVLEDLGEVDYVFVDGHHDEEATKAYFAMVKPRLRAGGTVVFDDIRWSDGMLRAWEAVRQDPDVAVSVDCGGVGLVAVDPGAGGRTDVRVVVG